MMSTAGSKLIVPVEQRRIPVENDIDEHFQLALLMDFPRATGKRKEEADGRGGVGCQGREECPPCRQRGNEPSCHQATSATCAHENGSIRAGSSEGMLEVRGMLITVREHVGP
jgi:hypothetical protein